MKRLIVLSTLFAACAPLPTRPDLPAASLSNSKTEILVILGTNDMHGALQPQQVKTREAAGVAPTPYEKGGAPMLAAHVRAYQAEYGNRVLLLDAGDCFQGSLESNLKEGSPMVTLHNHLGTAASAVGNHEFDFGPVGPEGTKGDPVGALQERMKESRYPWLAANIVEKSTGQTPTWPNTHRSRVLKVGNLNVGVIGLSTLETPASTRPTHVAHLQFTPLAAAALKESKELRAAGAQVVVLTAHAGLFCSRDNERPYGVWKPTDNQGICNPNDEMTKLLTELPQGTLDAVVSGHTHSVVHHWVNGVPVIQSGTRNANLSAIYLTYDLENKKVVTDRSRIEGPVPLCPMVFSNQNDCDGDKPAPKAGRGALRKPVFHGKTITPDAATVAVLQPVFDSVAEIKKRVIGQAARPVETVRDRESEMGNLVADAIRTQVQADFAVINPGGLRAPFEAGPITFEALFRTLPFDNNISRLTVTGKELKQILRVAESGAKGYFPVSGLQLSVLDLKSPAKSDDLNGDGKMDLWEVNRLIDVKTATGAPIEEASNYTLATLDFLVQGGDDLGWVMKQIPSERVELNAGPTVRDAAEAHIGRLGVIQSPQSPLVDSAQPRLIILKEYPQPKKASPRRSRTRRR